MIEATRISGSGPEAASAWEHDAVTIDLLLLLALPASGKSEIRRYLAHVTPEVATRDFHLGSTVQVDDYPYVHLMRRISEEQRRLGVDPTFFSSADEPFRDARDWLTLIHLVADDVAGLGRVRFHEGDRIIDRLVAARERAGFSDPTIAGGMPLRRAVGADTDALAATLPTPDPEDLTGATIVVEFARGGPHGATPPLPHPLGYQASVPALGPEIVERASILYVWVEPEESRRRNRERTRPGPDGDASILHHGVPEAVMLKDYGTDDMAWLEADSPVPGTIAIPTGALTTLIPVSRFDNREDRTSFLRDEPAMWPEAAVTRLHRDLTTVFARLV